MRNEAEHRSDIFWLDHHRGYDLRARRDYSHIVSLAEAKHIHEKGTGRLIIGAGQYGNVTLSDEAADYFKRKHCQVDLLPTPMAIRTWNESEGTVTGLFHVTC